MPSYTNSVTGWAIRCAGLRRMICVLRSYLTALGASVAVAKRCLNHRIGGLVGVYDQHDYLIERRAALTVWSEFLATCEHDQSWAAGKVIPIQRTA